MTATSINHVSVAARDLRASARFYREVFGMEAIATPTFGFPVQWLRLGDQQLHLFTRAERVHHFAVNVSDFEATYRRVEALGRHDATAFSSTLYELPDGAVQMYLRDPADNLVEVDWPDVETLDRSIRARVVELADAVPQRGDFAGATLYLDRRPA